MDNLPLARVTMIHVLRDGGRLIIYVEGLTSGFGGSLLVERRPERILPPLFHVHAIPGNDGINPAASPQNVPTKAANSFDAEGITDSIRVEWADGESQEVAVMEVKPGKVPGDSDEGDRSGDAGGEWLAIHDFMPPRPARLRVNGVLTMPTPGYTLTLTRANPQGINPRILILDLTSQPPTGIVAQVLTPTPVSYEELTDQHFDSVLIVPGNISIPVQEVN